VNWSHLLLPLTPLYAAAVRTRAALYRRGLRTAVRLASPVVSVGNLTFGGTGKTPTVVALVRDLVRRGRRPAVLTRGHGRSSRRPLVLVGPNPSSSPGRAGDEPLEMAARLPGVPIVVDRDRVRGGLEALRLGATVLVLDDGFQHQRIARDLDLVLIDAGDPWGGGQLPPRGRLREPVAAVVRASAVLVTKLSAGSDDRREEIVRSIRELAGDLPVFGARVEASRVRTPTGWQSPEIIAGRRVLAFAGVGRPEAFAELLTSAGAEVVSTAWFADHHRYRADELERLSADAERLGAVPVTTAKDAVKLPASSAFWVLEAEMVPLDGGWDALWSLLPGGDR
jgi:tetraacyldisaccharide 4'-kinase